MTDLEELEYRLDHLPDVYPDFTRCAMLILERYELSDEVLEMLRENDDATTETVINYELIRRGIATIVDEKEQHEA